MPLSLLSFTTALLAVVRAGSQTITAVYPPALTNVGRANSSNGVVINGGKQRFFGTTKPKPKLATASLSLPCGVLASATWLQHTSLLLA